ncbi:MAG: hypothetical protein PHP54_04985 [Clostridia bacterium]|nr:hypothetical protein [Clostridia bacterium]
MIKSNTSIFLRKKNKKGEENANETHNKISEKIRSTIESMCGTMPENLPTPEKSLKELAKEDKYLLDNH